MTREKSTKYHTVNLKQINLQISVSRRRTIEFDELVNVQISEKYKTLLNDGKLLKTERLFSLLINLLIIFSIYHLVYKTSEN